MDGRARSSRRLPSDRDQVISDAGLRKTGKASQGESDFRPRQSPSVESLSAPPAAPDNSSNTTMRPDVPMGQEIPIHAPRKRRSSFSMTMNRTEASEGLRLGKGKVTSAVADSKESKNIEDTTNDCSHYTLGGHLIETHIETLKLVYEDLQHQRTSYARLKLCLTKDLEAVDRAIWARREQERLREDQERDR
ncbi:hypothetical protein BKA70DRAFT_1240007 [Coprinopsis sp. MPI-PUGE-AT-0042]|nr:hypothetical protein BKA70DRAFT_1240007 [Coprinopsis sp. MPI-PUGE-AT-0042]